MKPAIHPTWYPDAVVTCACGNTWTTGSTKKEIHTDVCSKCHPFFTGEQRIVDTAGQVERFMKRINAKEQKAATAPGPEEKRAKKERRRGRKTGVEELPLAVAEAPAEQASLPAVAPKAELQPTPKVEGEPVEPDTVNEPGVEEVAALTDIEDLKPGENAESAPAGIIGQVASIDKIIEPTEVIGPAGETEGGEPGAEQASPRRNRPPREPRKKAGPAKPKASAPEEPKAEEPKAEEPKAE